MAQSDKNILITPNIGSTTADPTIVFSGADASTAAQNITVKMYPTNSGTLSFEGSTGQLFSISNTMSGTIFSANDVSGIPSIEVLDTGLVKIAQYSGNVLLGTATDNATDKLQVNGSITATQLKSTIATGTAPFTVASTTVVTNLNADLLDGNSSAAFYLATNPSGYTTNTGTVTSVGGTGSYGGLTLTGTVTTSGNLTLGGTPTGTWPISVSGNAATASTAVNLSTDRTNWVTNGTITAVVGQLAWKNYNNGHTIFDASAGTAPDGSAVNNTNSYFAWSGTFPTLMGWNGANTYGVRVDSARVSDSTSGNAATITSQANSATITASTAATASQIVLRDAGGDDFRRYGNAEYFNMSHAVNTAATTDTIFYSSTDDYIRKTNATSFRTSLNVPTRTGGDASGTWGIAVTGNAGTATTWATARTITIGSTGKSVDGSAAVSWSLAEIGAQSTLVSGTNIKTINGTSVLGSGDITTPGVSTGKAIAMAMIFGG